MHDAIEVEKRGIPAVAVCTDVFQRGAEAMARMRGLPGFSLALVPHPVGLLAEADMRERAKQAAAQVVHIVTGA